MVVVYRGMMMGVIDGYHPLMDPTYLHASNIHWSTRRPRTCGVSLLVNMINDLNIDIDAE